MTDARTGPPVAADRPDEPELVDLSPRNLQPRRGRRAMPIVILGAVVVVVAGLVWFLLTNSSGFYEADRAVAEREELGDRRIQLLGAPITTGDELDLGGEPGQSFSVVFDGAIVDVVFFGTTADLFQPNVPVVLEGNWVSNDTAAPPVSGFVCGANDGYWFRADTMMPKHDDEYRQDRIQLAGGRNEIDCPAAAEGSPDT